MNDELICDTPPGADRRLVLLHGWGADADDLIPLGRELCEGVDKPVELVALRAPHPHPQGVGRQWYGLFPTEFAAIPLAISQLKDRLKAIETADIPLQRTALLGFSQGGAMAVACGCELPFAGLIGCSAYPHSNWSPANIRPPVLLLHGLQDDIVPAKASEQLLHAMQNSPINAEMLTFSGGHGIPGELIPRMQQRLNNWFL